MEVVARRGFDATVDEIAQLSGVSPRTIFRQYRTQAALLAATLKDMVEAGSRPIEGLPQPSEDMDRWLEGLTLAVHTRNVEIYGEVIWELRAPKATLSPEISEVVTAELDFRRRVIGRLATVAWHAAGGAGTVPDALISAFTMNLSPFTTTTLMVDREMSPAQIGALTADISRTLLWRAVAEERSA
jgi:AcrR family transcriptional regulator